MDIKIGNTVSILDFHELAKQKNVVHIWDDDPNNLNEEEELHFDGVGLCLPLDVYMATKDMKLIVIATNPKSKTVSVNLAGFGIQPKFNTYRENGKVHADIVYYESLELPEFCFKIVE